MAPKTKINRDDIINASIELVRKRGRDAITARDIAAELGCSTQPIFSNFNSMEELEKQVIEAAYGIYTGQLKRESESGKYPKYKAYGMAYISFAKNEKELFRLLFMRDRNGEDIGPTADFEESIDYITAASGVTREKATLIHLEVWSAVHGIATMLATSFLSLEWELVSEMLSDVYLGIKKRHEETN